MGMGVGVGVLGAVRGCRGQGGGQRQAPGDR